MFKSLSLSCVVLLALLVGGCSTVGHQQTGIENFDQVSPTLYRGAQPSDHGYQTLVDHHVQTVINLRETRDPVEEAAVAKAGMTYLWLPLDAATVTLADAQKVLTAITSAKGPVFVHCHAGRDRTGMAIAAYRLKVQQWTAEAALQDMYAHGHYWALFPKVRQTIEALAKTTSEVATADAVKVAPPNN